MIIRIDFPDLCEQCLAGGLVASLDKQHAEGKSSATRLAGLRLEQMVQDVEEGHGRGAQGESQQQLPLVVGVRISHAEGLHVLDDLGVHISNEAGAVQGQQKGTGRDNMWRCMLTGTEAPCAQPRALDFPCIVCKADLARATWLSAVLVGGRGSV